MPASRQLSFLPTLALWTSLLLLFVLVAVFYAHISVLTGSFVSTFIAFALLLAGTLFFAARGLLDRFALLAGAGSPWLFAVLILFVFLIYALGAGYASLLRLAAVAAFIFVPLLILATAATGSAASWQDFLTLAIIWVSVKFGPSHWIWPYPDAHLAYIFTVITAVNVAIAGFLLLRRTKGVGYTIAWGSGWTLYILGSLAIFAVIAIPLGIKLHFIGFAPKLSQWKSFLPLSVAILFFTAWPEEFLFRGLLQNLLSRATRNDTVGWIAASILFGFSHITNMHFPNWRYVLLASVAGLFYGWTWRKTGSLFASALVHAGVDILWHFLFSTP